MLTRLCVNGFKNLVDVDVRFGAFTCVAGTNGVGKSNLFDAIRFLSALTSLPLREAALTVRDEEGGKTSDLRSLFHRVGDSYGDRMSFDAEMIVPKEAVDDTGQPANATSTLLRYQLHLGYREQNTTTRSLGVLEILKEELAHITLDKAGRTLLFPHEIEWRKSVALNKRNAPFFISTEGEGDKCVIKLHQDGGRAGRAFSRSARSLPRTVLSVANAAEGPTVLCVRREMQSWQLLQLEPTALRKPDDLNATPRLTSHGLHLPATLYRLANDHGVFEDAEHVYGTIAGRLAELIDDVKKIGIDRDDTRELLTAYLTANDDTPHPARSLSDGTLRFLALAVLELDSSERGVICLEEPENGIHPERIPSMIALLRDIATDTRHKVDDNNPLRQVIINTHSPTVVAEVPDDSLLVAQSQEIAEQTSAGLKLYKGIRFGALSNTWRTRLANVEPIAKGKLISYLNPVSRGQRLSDKSAKAGLGRTGKIIRRVVEHEDLQSLLPLGTEQ